MQPLKNASLCSSNTRVLVLLIVNCSDFTMQPSRVCQNSKVLNVTRIPACWSIWPPHCWETGPGYCCSLQKSEKEFQALFRPFLLVYEEAQILTFVPVLWIWTWRDPLNKARTRIPNQPIKVRQQDTPQAVPVPVFDNAEEQDCPSRIRMKKKKLFRIQPKKVSNPPWIGSVKDFWIIYSGPGFLAVVWFGSSSNPFRQSARQENWEMETTCWRERGGKGLGRSQIKRRLESLAL